MHRIAVSALLICVLAACSPSPPESPAPAPAAAPEQADRTPAPAATPAPATKPATPPAEGTCGDQGALPADQRIANTPRWTTASEQDNFGFDVYRGKSEKGPFVKLTTDPILGAGTSDETHKYEFRDDTIDPCQEYWYYVEAISTSGKHEKFTPTFKARAKRRAAGSAPDAEPAPTPPTPADDGTQGESS
ncbi:MAG TPA: hypothetical protein VFG55_04245 [Rhodanobacteraceae bacterium]|nr:hypothetical protein [Rhodanobacteraceae bacterium]